MAFNTHVSLSSCEDSLAIDTVMDITQAKLEQAFPRVMLDHIKASLSRVNTAHHNAETGAYSCTGSLQIVSPNGKKALPVTYTIDSIDGVTLYGF